MSVNTLLNERPTFGVEVEFLIAILRQGEKDPHANVKGIPPVLRVPPTEPLVEPNEYAHRRVREVLDKCFGSLPTQFIQVSSRPPVLDMFRNWDVDMDESIIPTEGGLYDKYTWAQVEIASPVQYASPKGFEAISLAISLITSKFRCHVNGSCGIHVHVGLGADRIPLEHMRRMGSLSYAVEPLLYTLQHPAREVNFNCRPIRYYSRLVKEGPETDNQVGHSNPAPSDGEFYCTQLGRERRHGEERLSVREKNDSTTNDAFLETRKVGHYEPFTTPNDSRHTTLLPSDISETLDLRISTVPQPSPLTTSPAEPARQRQIPRLVLKKYSRPDLDILNDVNRPWGTDLSDARLDERIDGEPGPSVHEVTERIYSQPSTCNIGHLLTTVTGSRLGMSFHHYLCTRFNPPERSPRTIEVRMGEGSLDGEWISTWAKIITGLFKFALYASPSDFIDVLEKCESATKIEGAYDVVDLLDDIGLFAEAVIVEKRLMAHKDEWGLKFVESS
ncbi:putative amidoligase enzyme-domain-containing protein [Xylaria cf. heliscus]|nr:putative amidoligase enzyme-domain-containing protein [Xylaria cf. heliscus]